MEALADPGKNLGFHSRCGENPLEMGAGERHEQGTAWRGRERRV